MFNFDGHDISEYGCFVCETPIFPTPERRVNKIEIPGRDGYLTEDEGTYENISVTYDVILLASEVYPHSIETALHKIRAWLITDMSFKKLRDDNHVGGFYWARCDGLNDFEYVNDKAVKFSITFDCEPFFYHDEGQEVIKHYVEQGNLFTISPFGNYFSEPIIEVEAGGKEVKINSFNISTGTTGTLSNFTIDSKLKIVISNDTSVTEHYGKDLSNLVTGNYITFSPHYQITIQFYGAYSLYITPNWRSI